MTKLEKLALREAALKDQLLSLQRSRQATEKQRRQARRLHVGMLMDIAGLLDVDDAVLRPLLALVAPLVDLPDPVATLEALLADGVMVGTAAKE